MSGLVYMYQSGIGILKESGVGSCVEVSVRYWVIEGIRCRVLCISISQVLGY